MFKKVSLAVIAGILYSQPAAAIQNSAEYTACMARESSDAGTTKCYENEIKYFEKMTDDNLKYMKDWQRYSKLVNSKEYGLDDQYKAFTDFLDSFCRYYVKAKENQGYSKAYLEADCRLGYVQMYAGYLQGLITKGASPCIEDIE